MAAAETLRMFENSGSETVEETETVGAETVGGGP